MSAPPAFTTRPRQRVWPAIAAGVVVAVLTVALALLLVLRPGPSPAVVESSAPVTVTQPAITPDEAQARTCAVVVAAQRRSDELNVEMWRGLKRDRRNLYATPGIGPRLDTYTAAAGPLWQGVLDGIVPGTPTEVAWVMQDLASTNLVIVGRLRTRTSTTDKVDRLVFFDAAASTICRTNW